MTTYHIDSSGSFITATSGGGTLYFVAKYPDGDPNEPGQDWIAGDDTSNTTLVVRFPDGTDPIYMGADDNTEGSYVGGQMNLTNTCYWSIESDGSLQLVVDGQPGGQYAVIGGNGVMALSKTPTTKWKFTKVTHKQGTR